MLVELLFSPFLPHDFSSLEELNLMRDDVASRSYVAAKVDFQENLINAIYDAAKEIALIKRDLYLHKNKEYNADIDPSSLTRQIQFSAGRLWILSGMCLLEVFSSISPVDQLQKTKIRIECSEAEVF